MSRNYKNRKKTTNSNGRNIVIITLIAVILLALVFVLVADYRKKVAEESRLTANIYYLDSATASLKPEKRPLFHTSNSAIVKFVLEELVMGPKSVSLLPSVPQNIVESANISGSNVTVNLSSAYKNLKLDEEIICRTALVNTLTSLGFVDSITINVDGEELLKPNGQPFGKMKLSDVVTTPDLAPKGESTKSIILYFADQDQTGLVEETRSVVIKPNESYAKYIVTELIKGPLSSGLIATIPKETQVLDINTAEGICYVDLSKEFVTKHTGGEMQELLTIYSIVNSLTELGDIRNVQFLIEGERLEQFKGSVDFSNLFEHKEMPPEETP